jgi:metallo-beta-lactamase family protein
MKLTFLGAARTVTGSMHLLEVGGTRVLLDCGLYQGKRTEAHERNAHLPDAAVRADACILSHAHIDHSGNLPQLVKDGFKGSIFAQRATRQLCDVMLLDSAHIQQKDFEYLTKHGNASYEPIYDEDDVRAAMARFVPQRYGTWFDVLPNIRAQFHDAGHILGSAVTEIEAREGSNVRRICFTGDLGRRGMPILRDPEALPACDVVITESTYGDRVHPPVVDNENELAAMVREQARRGGRTIIPAFSVGRTQNLVYALYRIYKRGAAPRLPIFVDSPLSTQVTKIVSNNSEYFDDEALAVLGAGGAPFYFPEIHYTASVEESIALNDRKGAFIIISASGMCESGRVLHHLKHSIEDPATLILIVGYQAEHTLGRRILEGAARVRIFGEEKEVRAQVKKMNAMSAHADRNDLAHYVEPVARSCGQVFIVHGDPLPAESLAKLVRQSACGQVVVPSQGETHNII